MELTKKLLTELQKRLKIGNRRGVHLNAIPSNSKYKFDLNRLAHVDKNLPNNFITELLTKQPLKFRISWKENVPDLNSLFEEDQAQLVKITKAFENLINQTEAIESEKGINTFGFGFPILARRDKADNKLTVAPILIWSLRIKRTKEFNTWEILRNEDDPIYINEVLINHLQSDAHVAIDPIPSEMLDDGLIESSELVEICYNLIKTINTSVSDDLKQTFEKKLENITSIRDKKHYEELPLNFSNSLIDFSGLFSIFEVQKQNIINDFDELLKLKGQEINLDDLIGNSFQSISSVETDPSQQSILHALESKRNILIQGPPGTGKSQTLTAVLINALENNKKTIVVCEKRTALEVLHNALIEKGLSNNCVLIRDIIKDRKTAVDSVRNRVDDSSYKRYHYNYSKESLDAVLLKAKNLISSINKKHQKVGQEILGSKNWTNIVGQYLQENKNRKQESKLKIDNNQFEYSTKELNNYLDLIHKGNQSYLDYLPIKSVTFLNPQKLIGDNPYLVKQNINNDFDGYTEQVENIKTLLKKSRKEYLEIRKKEFINQINLLNNSIEKITTQENEFETIYINSKLDFSNFREREFEEQLKLISDEIEKTREINNEFNNLLSVQIEKFIDFRISEFNSQYEKIKKTINLINNIERENDENNDFYDETKVRNIPFKLLALISKRKRKVILDHQKLNELFTILKTDIDKSKDVLSVDFDNDLKSKFKSLLQFDIDLKINKDKFEDKCKNEFQSYQIFSLLDAKDPKKSLQLMIIETDNNSTDFNNLITSIKLSFEDFFESKDSTFKNIHLLIEKSKYLNIVYSLDGTISENIVTCLRIKNEINLIAQKVIEKIDFEFSNLNLKDLLYSTDYVKSFAPIELLINDIDNSDSFKLKLKSIKFKFIEYLEKSNLIFKEISNYLVKSKDILFENKFENLYFENKNAVNDLLKNMEVYKKEFDFKANNEFDQIISSIGFSDLKGYQKISDLKEKLSALTNKINTDNWIPKKIQANNFNQLIEEIESRISKKEYYFSLDQDYFSIEFRWFQFFNSLTPEDKTIINALIETEDWRKTFLIHYLHSLLISSADMDLPTNDNEHKELDIVLQGIEKEQLKYINELWFSKQIDKSREFEQQNTNLSVVNLYNKRSSPKFKRLSLRQIVQFDADLFTCFFPIILTSPDVASNLFKGMNGYFDIVMFDEASQLRLEDNLPAILKGKQIIIAGDEHQMPPSNYFSKIFDGDVEDEEDEEEEKIVVDRDNLLLSCESLLEFGSELKFEKQHLDFHYRSRHPYLIDFSNYAFYDQRLKPLPTNFEYVPIKFIQVNGVFTEHTNEAEAEMVLSIIDKNINRLPNGAYPTLGIATFNIAQRNLIKSKILERQKFSKYEEFNSKIQELEDNGMFIKNLENIQGDERDVIILSTTYGVGKDRKFTQRFGPINHTKGYKLLNVIITRAKYKVYVCSSIPEEVFMNYKDYLITEGSNNKRAVLYAYLAYSKAVSECNNESRISVLTTLAENTKTTVSYNSFLGEGLESPFEEEVYQRLVDELGNQNLIPQLKVSEFRIDIVYDPKLVGVPKIAIECDGAKYHSSREAYLHDRHRQKILEDHGFVFHRIWSTNWWDNPGRETAKLISFIKQVESSNPNLENQINTAAAFTDDIEISEGFDWQNSPNELVKDSEITQGIERIKPIEVNLQTIGISSKVKVKYNNGKNITIQIMKTQKDRNKVVEGVHNIYCKSPLAISIIGHTIGDIVKIGDLDNFVEILEIKN